MPAEHSAGSSDQTLPITRLARRRLVTRGNRSKLRTQKKIANVLISRPIGIGQLWHFNLLDHTGEFRFDHEADHVHGMLLLEAVRQASIAAAHLQGFPEEGQLTLASYDSEFFNFIAPSVPVVIRAYTSIPSSNPQDVQQAFFICGVYQWGRLCAQACIKAHAFVSKGAYLHQRQRSLRISERLRRNHANHLHSLGL